MKVQYLATLALAPGLSFGSVMAVEANPCAGNPCVPANPCAGNPCAGNLYAGNPCRDPLCGQSSSGSNIIRSQLRQSMAESTTVVTGRA